MQERSLQVFVKWSLQTMFQIHFLIVGIDVWAAELMTSKVNSMFCLLLSLVSFLPAWQTELTLAHPVSCSLPTKTNLLLQKHHHPPHLSSYWWRCMQSPQAAFYIMTHWVLGMMMMTNQRYTTRSDRDTVTFGFSLVIYLQQTQSCLSVNLKPKGWTLTNSCQTF